MTKQSEIEPYLGRRQALMDLAGNGVIVVRGCGGDPVNASFFYLTGIVEPRAILLLAPDGMQLRPYPPTPGPDYICGAKVRQLLLLPETDAFAERWGESGPVHSGMPPGQFGVDLVFPANRLDAVLDQALNAADCLHYVRALPASIGRRDDEDSNFVARIRNSFFDLPIEDATPLVHEARRLKDNAEIAAIERSVAVVGQALERAMQLVRPGLHEYEVEAEIAAVYRRSGGVHAFEPIVGCGANALKLHYRDNAGELSAGRLLLIDTGVSLGGYRADITRTIPVDGRFNERQREVYDAVLEAQQQAIALCRPGALISDLHAVAHESLSAAGFAEQFVHGIGHHLGLETHDVGDLRRELAPGAVITIEPGVYLDDEQIGIRIEDDVLITEGGCRVLSAGIPTCADEIEKLMAGASA